MLLRARYPMIQSIEYVYLIGYFYGMTLEQLRIFVEVAQSLNMTRAAQALNLTQPSVSAAIAALEGRHGLRLFDRVGRSIELSEAGRAFLPEARGVLARAREAAQALDDLAGLRRGHLRIAASQTVATYWLPARMARFAQRHPGITLALTLGNTQGGRRRCWRAMPIWPLSRARRRAICCA
jgi:DNA-binding transcriptional LysR family regulator